MLTAVLAAPEEAAKRIAELIAVAAAVAVVAVERGNTAVAADAVVKAVGTAEVAAGTAEVIAAYTVKAAEAVGTAAAAAAHTEDAAALAVAVADVSFGCFELAAVSAISNLVQGADRCNGSKCHDWCGHVSTSCRLLTLAPLVKSGLLLVCFSKGIEVRCALLSCSCSISQC